MGRLARNSSDVESAEVASIHRLLVGLQVNAHGCEDRSHTYGVHAHC